MKNILVGLFLFIGIGSLSAQNLIGYSDNSFATNRTSEIVENFQTVYVCNGEYAYAYHSRANCPGLGNCKGSVNYTNQSYAVNQMDRVPCCRCWSNVADRCRDDNPSYGGYGGGGDNSEAYAYVAIAMVAASAAILSNDLYLYPTYSFNGIENLPATGWSFGFRKTFKNSALEYGASIMTPVTNTSYYYYDQGRWGAHLNYVQSFLYKSTPDWVRLYVGPSLNYITDFGYGGVAGARMRIIDRLKFDVRYELTTETNQIQAGLIFTYQKKYFWKR